MKNRKENFSRLDPKAARNVALCGRILELIKEFLHKRKLV